MTTPPNPRKWASALGALALAGLLAAPAARADLMDFYNAAAWGAPAISYQPITNVHVTYTGVSVINGYGVDHTTGNSSGAYLFAWQNFYLGITGYPLPATETFTFDRPVAIPSLYYATYLDQRPANPPGETNVTILAFADTAGSSLLYSNTVVGKGPAWSTNWTAFTDLAAYGTNIMRVDFSAGAVAVVDDLTINRSPVGTLQRIHDFQWSQTNLVRGQSAQAIIMADYTLDTNDVAPWCSYVSSDTSVATISSGGLLSAVAPGTATITASYLGNTLTNTVTVLVPPMAATLVPFGNPNIGGVAAGQYAAELMPATYQPVAGLTISWYDTGEMFDGGPDHLWGAFQSTDVTTPQAYWFSTPVSLPSLRLTTRAGAGDSVTITVYDSSFNLLGTETVATPVHGGPGNFKWVQCTALDKPAYNGQIGQVQISSPGNAEVDDMLVQPNWGTLTALYLQYTRTNLVPTMTGQATVLADYTGQSGVNVTANASYSSSNPSAATVSPTGLVRAVGAGTATISASLLGFTQTVDVVVTALPANATLVNFNDGLPANTYDFVAIPASYEPVTDLYLTYANIELFNGTYNGAAYGGPDHTAGTSGGNAYCGFAAATNNPSTFTFNRPVGIPSVWLTTSQGGSATNKSSDILVRAFADVAGTTLLYSNIVTTPLPVITWQTEFTSLASLGTTIKRLDFTSTGIPCFDDMTVVAPPLGSLLALHLQLQQTNNLQVNSAQQATVLADYANVSNVDVTLGLGTVFSSSSNAVVMVTTNGLVTAVAAGSANITATLGTVSNSVTVTVTPFPPGTSVVNFNDGLPGTLSFNPLPATYEPVTNLFMSYVNAELDNGYYGTTYNAGVDHTTGTAIYGANHYFIGSLTPALANATAVFTFNRPVSILSIFLITAQGNGTTKSTNVTVRAWSDSAGTILLSSNNVPTPLPTSPWPWTQYTNLATLGTNIMRVDFYSTGLACLDDMALIAPPTGNLLALRLQLPLTNWVPNQSQYAAATADFASVSNVSVTYGCGTVFSSSNTNILTVNSGSALVKAIRPGTATISATLSNVTSSVDVTVAALRLQYGVSGSPGSANLTFNWPTYATTNYILESSALVGPGASWTTVTNARTTVGSNYQIQVAVVPGTPAAFFRLRLLP